MTRPGVAERGAASASVTIVAIGSIVACAVVSACASAPRAADPTAGLALAAVERAFAASAAEAGVRSAFLRFLADDATLFRPGPVPGKPFFEAQPERPYRLEWQPQRVTVAGSGELGYSTGPYRLTPDSTPGEPAYGQFFTIWKRNASGRWAVLYDLGDQQPGPAGWSAPLDVIASDPGIVPVESVAAAESAFAAVSRTKGLPAAYRLAASTRVRILRDGLDPLDGIDALESLPGVDATWTWTFTAGGTSRSGDFAWATGRYRRDDGGGGYYVRAWRAEDGAWKILGEALAPIDEPTH